LFAPPSLPTKDDKEPDLLPPKTDGKEDQKA
jgi:hypothetical protein